MNQLKNSLHYFSIVMIFVYVIIAMILIFSDGIVILPQPNRSILAVVLLLYAAFKAYRVFTKSRAQQIDEEN